MPAASADTPRIHVACCFDDAMAIPASVVAASAAAATRDAHVTFYMVHAPRLSIDLAALKRGLDDALFTLVDCVIEDDMSGLYATRQYSDAMYYRFALPRFVASDRVVYLDSDTMVRRSLRALYETDLGENVVAACKDYALVHQMRDHGMPVRHLGKHRSVSDYMRDVVGIDLETTDYFNTGVLVMDLARWERDKLSERCLAFCRGQAALVMADQDAANHVLQGAFARLDPRWNAFSYMYDEFFPPQDGPYRPEIYGGFGKRFTRPEGEWRDVLTAWARDPWIVHSSFKSKPWNDSHRRTPYDAEYWTHVARTPFEASLRARLATSRRWGRLLRPVRPLFDAFVRATRGRPVW